jgi:predicted nucleotidyltransferase
MVPGRFSLSPEQDALILRILAQHLADRRGTVYVFGSRAKGTARKYSDVDLLLELDPPAEAKLLGDLADAFEESSLPFTVDVVSFSELNLHYKDEILKTRQSYLRFPSKPTQG